MRQLVSTTNSCEMPLIPLEKSLFYSKEEILVAENYVSNSIASAVCTVNNDAADEELTCVHQTNIVQANPTRCNHPSNVGSWFDDSYFQKW